MRWLEFCIWMVGMEKDVIVRRLWRMRKFEFKGIMWVGRCNDGREVIMVMWGSRDR